MSEKYKEVIKAFIVSRIVIFSVAYVLFYLFMHHYFSLPFAPPNYVENGQGTLNWRPLNVLYYYDAVHYIDIAENGYDKWWLTCWFPLYPLLIRAFGSTVASAVIVSNLSLLIALFAIYQLGGKKALWLAAFSPISIVFSSVYSESLFLALTAWGMVAAERKKPVLCGILIGLAALTRPLGWTTIIGVGVFLALKQGLKAATNVILLGSIIGLLYPVYLFLQFGDPLLFINANTIIFGREICLPFSLLLTDIKHLFCGHDLKSIIILLNFTGFLLLFKGITTKWWPYTLVYALIVLCSGITNQKAWIGYSPYVFGLLRYTGACAPVYLTNHQESILPWIIFSIIIDILITFKLFIF